MAKIVMTECKLRETKFVPKKDVEPVEFTAIDLIERFNLNPKTDPRHLFILRTLKPDSFVGISFNPTTGKNAIFYWHHEDQRNDIGRVLKKDPTFSSRLVEVWRVESSHWDSKFEETVTQSH
jgi:hypothetical protein